MSSSTFLFQSQEAQVPLLSQMSIFLVVKCHSIADTYEEAKDLTVLFEFCSWFGLQVSILRKFLKSLENR